MRLIGMLDSPYVRRTGISLKMMGLAFAHEPVSVFRHYDHFASINPVVKAPTLVVWGMLDKALLPIQLEGLNELIDDLTVVRLPDVGHFAPWEAPDAVADALRPFLAGEAAATAAAT